MDFSVFKNKKILLTGHTGFKGSWLSIWLLRYGAEIVGYSLSPKTKYDNYCVSKLSGRIKEYISDIRDKDKLLKVFSTEKPEIIFHLAAQPLVLDGYKDPLYTIETNTLGTANILEAFRLTNVAKLLVVITTDKVYENFEFEKCYNETNRLGGKDPYSASKASAELIANAYIESFNLNNVKKQVVTVRAGNVIGGGDWSKYRIIPDCIKAIENNKEIIIRNPSAVRPWQHVLEPLGGYLYLAEKIIKNEDNLSGAWNFGPVKENHIPVLELVKLLVNYYGTGSFKIIVDNTAPKEANYLFLDITKAKEKLNWQPCLSVDEAIATTVDWYRNYHTNNMFEFCCNQIERYMEKWKSKNIG